MSVIFIFVPWQQLPRLFRRLILRRIGCGQEMNRSLKMSCFWEREGDTPKKYRSATHHDTREAVNINILLVTW